MLCRRAGPELPSGFGIHDPDSDTLTSQPLCKPTDGFIQTDDEIAITNHVLALRFIVS